MNKPLLIWQNGIFPDSELCAAEKYFDIIRLDFLDTLKISSFIEQDKPYSFRGSLAFAYKLGFRQEEFNCSKWVPHFYDDMLSQDFYWQIAEKVTIPIGGHLFVKSDSCKKIIAGQVFNESKWQEELNYLRQRNSEKILCFCATPEVIGKEIRCIFVGMELIDMTVYMDNGEILDTPYNILPGMGIPELAKKIRANQYFSPEDNLTIDIGKKLFQGYRLIEINQLETSGWYSANPSKIYEKLAAQLNYE